MFIKNLTIGKKIAGAFFIIAVINLGFGLFLINELGTIKSQLLNYTDDTLPAMQNVDSVRDKMSYWRRTQFAVLALQDEGEIKQTIVRNEGIRQEINASLAAYGKSVWPGEEEQTFKRLMTSWNSYLTVMDRFNSAMLDMDKDKAHPILAQSLSQFEGIEADVNKLMGILQEAMDDNRDTILDSVNGLSSSSLVSNIAILVLMVAMTILLTRIICGPLNLVVEQANEIANGNLTAKIDRTSIGADELGDLADASQRMQDNLRGLIEEIIGAVSQLTSAVGSMTDISQSSAEGMKEQQHQITQVATAMTQMKAAVGDVANNTEHSAEQANTANEQAQLGARDNESMVGAIEEVAAVIGSAGQTVSELEQQSRQINVVLDVIRDIADQTNLLALNAAIEAARAGETGRGFAVVADEVRTLAGRTQQSTGEITTIIEKLQKMAKEAVEATERSITDIASCVEQGKSSQQLMISIEEAIGHIADMGTQIASACSEQDSVADELSRNIEHIHVSSLDVAKGSEQTVSSCADLAQLSSQLQQATGRFKL